MRVFDGDDLRVEIFFETWDFFFSFFFLLQERYVSEKFVGEFSESSGKIFHGGTIILIIGSKKN